MFRRRRPATDAPPFGAVVAARPERGDQPRPADVTPERVRGGILLMLACSMIFASLDATAKFMGTHYPVLQIVCFRYTFHVLGMLAVFVPIMGREMFRATNLRWQLGRGLILVVCTICSFTALRFMPLAEFTAIAFVTPLLVTLFAGPMLGKKSAWGAGSRWVSVSPAW